MDTIRSYLSWKIFLALAICCWPLVAIGQAASPTDTYPELGMILKAMVDAGSKGHWLVLVVFAMVLAISLVRRLPIGWFKNTAIGGWVLNVMVVSGTVFGGALLAGQAITWQLVVAVFIGIGGVAGAWEGVKDIAQWLVEKGWLNSGGLVWLKMIFSLLGAIPKSPGPIPGPVDGPPPTGIVINRQ